MRCAKIVAMSLGSLGKETGEFFLYVSVSKQYIIVSRSCRSRFLNAASVAGDSPRVRGEAKNAGAEEGCSRGCVAFHSCGQFCR